VKDAPPCLAYRPVLRFGDYFFAPLIDCRVDQRRSKGDNNGVIDVRDKRSHDAKHIENFPPSEVCEVGIREVEIILYRAL
jgi:hypothetical protein